MKPLLKILTTVPFVFLASCSPSKNETPLTEEEFQKMAYALEEHYYAKATVTQNLITSEYYPPEEWSRIRETNKSSVYHFDKQSHAWIQDEGDLTLKDVFMPQTLRDMNVAETMDRRYDYTFYVDPIRVHMHRSSSDEIWRADYTWDWQYDSYGYLIYVHSYQTDENYQAEGDSRIIESTLRYVYE